MKTIPNTSMTCEYFVPNYARRIVQVGNVKKEILACIPSSIPVEKINLSRFDEASANQTCGEADLVMVGSDVAVDLTQRLQIAARLLHNHGQCCVFFEGELIDIEHEIDPVLTLLGLMRYRIGTVFDDEAVFPSNRMYALVSVKIGYNPVIHARKIAENNQIQKALRVLEDIPEDFLSDTHLENLLHLEKEKYKQLLRKSDGQSLFVGLVSGENYGWGVCSRYLIQELSKMVPIKVINSEDGCDRLTDLNGPVFQALTNIHLDALFPNIRGITNFGYTFFENELTEKSRENAKLFDMVFGGSSWCVARMKDKGIANCDVLIQGIDPDVFYPIESSHKKSRDHFVIFSGGKFELRKGQDLVLRAVKIMQDKYPDVLLINCWYNLWPASAKLMAYSRYIKFQYHENESWTETMLRTYHDNGLDPSRIQTLELIPQKEQRALFAQTDIGVFPNRCEGGTNLVLMEYMACGKPVIAANNSGHKDILTPQNALLLNQMSDFQITDNDGELIARWQDPSLDELVAQLEYAYHHRDELADLGVQAGLDLKRFTWTHTAQKLAEYLPSAV